MMDLNNSKTRHA